MPDPNRDRESNPWTGNLDWGVALGAIVIALAIVLLIASSPAK